MKVVSAGFSNPRKKLRTSLAGGLGISKDACELLLQQAGVDCDLRAQDLSLYEWRQIASFIPV